MVSSYARFSVEQFSERKKKQRELAQNLLEVGGASKALLLAKGYSRMVIKQVSEAKGITR